MSMYPISPCVLEARLLYDANQITRAAYAAFKSQHDSAKSRGIPFLFSFADWWAWWKVDNRWEKRGLKGNGFVMARYGDAGPYAEWNVYCATHAQNIADQDKAKLSAAQKLRHQRFIEAGGVHHLAVRGDGHPSSRAVITPRGRFGSAALAGESYHVTRAGASMRANRREKGWYWEDSPPTVENPVDMKGDYPLGARGAYASNAKENK